MRTAPERSCSGGYDNKKKTHEEIENIKGALKESLLNLQYILSNLQQIEVTINSVSVSKYLQAGYQAGQ